MTKADEIHDYLEQVKSANNPEQIINIASSFFLRTDLYPWRVIDIEGVSRDCWSVLISKKGRRKETTNLTYDCRRNAWRKNGIIASDAEIAEYLGVPLSYIMGCSDVLIEVRALMMEYTRKCEKLEKSRRNAITSQQRARRKENKLTEKAVLNKQIKKIKKSLGERTAKEITKVRNEVDHKKAMLAIDSFFTTVNAISEAHGYQKVPPPMTEAVHPDDSGLPNTSGIYFVWSGPVVYVGQSVSLLRRAHVKHERIKEGDWLSWVEVEKSLLDFAECFYIGVLHPTRNFGLKAWCNKAKPDVAWRC